MVGMRRRREKKKTKLTSTFQFGCQNSKLRDDQNDAAVKIGNNFKTAFSGKNKAN